MQLNNESRSATARSKAVQSGPSGNELASIIILCCNQLEFTRQCLESLVRHTRPPYELILVDNGSTDGTREYLAKVEREAQSAQDAPPRL